MGSYLEDKENIVTVGKLVVLDLRGGGGPPAQAWQIGPGMRTRGTRSSRGRRRKDDLMVVPCILLGNHTDQLSVPHPHPHSVGVVGINRLRDDHRSQVVVR